MLSVCLFAEEVLQAQYINNFDQPAYDYDFVIGKQDGNLYFYKTDISTDSIRVSQFTCNAQGIYSEKNIINSFVYPSESETLGTLILSEYKYNKIYSHVLRGSSLVILITNEDGTTENHVINTQGCQFNFNVSDYYKPYFLFNETKIVTSNEIRIYIIDLLTNQINEFYEGPGSCYFNQFSFTDDFIIFIDYANNENYYLTKNFTLQSMNDIFDNWSFSPKSMIGDKYYITSMYYCIPGMKNYMIFYLENDTLGYIDVFPGIESFQFLFDESAVSLNDNKYICKFTSSDPEMGEVYYHSFVTCDIINNERVYYPGFPNLEDVPDPISLHRINDQAVIALSGANNSSLNICVIDMQREQLNTQSFSIDNNVHNNYKIIAAGNYFYMQKADEFHSFKLETVVSTHDHDVPALENISCYPNPFKDQIKIKLTSKKGISKTTVSIYDIKGRKVKTLINQQPVSEKTEIVWDGLNDKGHKQASGIYFVKVESETSKQTKKIMLLK